MPLERRQQQATDAISREAVQTRMLKRKKRRGRSKRGGAEERSRFCGVVVVIESDRLTLATCFSLFVDRMDDG